jgi:hypothetical protein
VQLLQHKSAFDPPLFSACATESSIPQFFRDRALSLLLASTASGADDGCAWLILASASVGSGNLTAALEHLANAHQLDMTEACALSNRSIVLQLKGDHAEAFEAVKEAITLRCGRNELSSARILNTNQRRCFFSVFLSHFPSPAPLCPSCTTISAFSSAT